MAEQLANQAASTLNGAIDNVVTSLVVANGTVFPASGNFRILIESELILVGARSGDTLSSLTRGIESTTAVAHNTPAAVTHILTAGGFLQFMIDNAVQKPASIVSGEAVTWNGSGWDRSSTTRIGTS